MHDISQCMLHFLPNLKYYYTNFHTILCFQSVQEEEYTFNGVTTDMEDEFFWFGLVYNGWLGVVTLYIDGDVRSHYS